MPIYVVTRQQLYFSGYHYILFKGQQKRLTCLIHIYIATRQQFCLTGYHNILFMGGAQWLSGRVLDLRPRGPGSSLTCVIGLCP